MSNLTRIQNNNASLDACIEKANALPDAGSGGSVETCTVTISFTGSAEGYGEFGGPIFLYSKVVSGASEFTTLNISQDDTTVTDVLLGSIMILIMPDNYSALGGLSTENCELVYDLQVGVATTKSAFISNASEATIRIG